MMRRLMEGWRRLRSVRQRKELERRLDEEIGFHIEHQTEKNVRAGMAPDAARRQALLTFGGVERAKEATRDQLRLVSIEDFARDLRYGARALLRAPGFTVVATLTLAVGIGATTAMFSVVNGILLRPLPYPHQDRLIELVHEAPGLGAGDLYASPAIYFAYREHSRTFESVGLWDWDTSPVTVTGSGDPEAVPALQVTHEILPMLGADAIIGRGFSQADDLPGSPAVAIISHGYWRRHFGGADPLTQKLIVDGIPRQVIGVLPSSCRFFEYPADIFYPLQPVRSSAVFPSFDGRGIARLKNGVTLQQANADVARIIPIMAKEFASPNFSLPTGARFGPKLRLLRDTVVGNLGDTLWLLMGTIGLLLAIACANVANLVLVRTLTRRPELAIRTALGAGSLAIARAVFAESAILGLVGGVTGLAVAYVSLPLLLSLGRADLPQIMTVAIDPAVMLVTLGTSLVATLVFAVLPVFQLAWPTLRLTSALHDAGRSMTEGRPGRRVRQLLVIAQVALALVLLVAAGLMARTFQTLRSVNPGFRDPATVQTFLLRIPRAGDRRQAAAGEGEAQGTLRLQQAILDGLRAVPGVGSAGFASFNDGLPMDDDGREISMPYIDGRAAADGFERTYEMQRVSPEFFETIGTRLVAGRTIDWDDIYNRRPVMLVSENLARETWGSALAAIGRHMGADPSTPGSEIVGVVQDVHHSGLSQPAPETVIFPAVPTDTAVFVIRSERAGTEAFLNDLRKALWSVNGTLSLGGVRTLGDLYRHSMARTSMTLQLLAITGTLALLLGVIGIYGVVSYAISQRRREIGIRLALGAAQREIRRMFVRQALSVVGIGVVIGAVAAIGLTRVMRSQLFGVSPLDPATHLAVSGALLLAAGLASYLAARRTSRLDPVEVLRGE